MAVGLAGYRTKQPLPKKKNGLDLSPTHTDTHAQLSQESLTPGQQLALSISVMTCAWHLCLSALSGGLMAIFSPATNKHNTPTWPDVEALPDTQAK